MTDRKDRGKVGVAPAAPTPLPDHQLAELRRAHKPSRDEAIGGAEVCDMCYRMWPCTISRLLTMIPEGTAA